MENSSANAIESKRNLEFPMENPFSLKFGQIFTGFGIGCGVGIGVGRPIYLGAIPALQQVMSATRGATDAFSGVGMHVNNSLRKLGMKNIEAGVGCGVGIGHGFGAGITLKPGVVNRIQSSVAQLVTRLVMRMGPSIQSVIPGSVQNSVDVLRGTSGGNVQSSISSLLEPASNITGSKVQLSRGNGSSHRDPLHIPYGSTGTPSSTSHGSRTEKVLDSFLQNPLFKQGEDVEVNELDGNLRSENNVLHMLLKHQQAIQELMEENQKLQKILIEDLKVPPNKLRASNGSMMKFKDLSSDCFECRRRRRKGAS